MVGVLLNLDAKSPNSNTVSLFVDGKRVSEPQALPENMQGKPLFPHVSFRNASLQVNFSPKPLKALPFTCRALANAAKDDVTVKKTQAPKDGKYEVVFPVGFPDEGTFDWLDAFLEENPELTELSDRKIIEWAQKSGLYRRSVHHHGFATSGDKPHAGFGLPAMDDFSARRVINAIACVVPRHYVVMEVKENLVESDRKANLKRFSASHFKKVAML